MSDLDDLAAASREAARRSGEPRAVRVYVTPGVVPPVFPPAVDVGYQERTPYRDELHRGLARLTVAGIVVAMVVAVLLGMCSCALIVSRMAPVPSRPVGR